MRTSIPAFILAAALLTAPASKSHSVESGKATATPENIPEAPEAKATTTAPTWKIRHFTLSQDGAQVTVDEVGTKRTTTLKSKATDGDRLLSATFTAESGELRVEAMIGGTRHSLVQKAAGLDKAVSRSSAGPTEEDRKKYEALSNEARGKFREALRERFRDQDFRNAPEEERRNAVRAIFEKIEKEDRDGR